MDIRLSGIGLRWHEALGHTVLLTLVYVLSIWNRLWKGCLESECHVRMSVIINVYERHLAAITCHVVWHLADQ